MDSSENRQLLLPPPPRPRGIDTAQLLKALGRRWFLALAVGMICMAGAAGGTWFLLPPKYTAQSLVKLSADTGSMVRDLVDTQSQGRPDFDLFYRTQTHLVRSRRVLLSALQSDELRDLYDGNLTDAEKAVDWLAANLQVGAPVMPGQPARDSELFMIGLSGPDPEALVSLVNAITDAYQREILGQDHSHRQERLVKLQELHIKFENELRAKRQRLRKLVELSGAGRPEQGVVKQRLTLDEHSWAQKELVQWQTDLAKTRMEIQGLRVKEKNLSNPSITEALVDQALNTDPFVQSQRSKRAKLEAALDMFRADGGRFGSIKDEIASIDKNLQGYRERLRAQMVKTAREQAVEELKMNLAVQHDKEAFLQQVIQARAEEVRRLEDRAKQAVAEPNGLQELEDEIAVTDSLYKNLRKESAAITVQLAAPARIEIIDRATRQATRMDFKRHWKATAAAGIGALLMALVVISLVEYRSARIHSADQVIHDLGMRLVGTVPAPPTFKGRLWLGVSAKHDVYWRNLVSESADLIRTMVLHAAQTERLRTIMVTSAVKGEGKTSVATHLAGSLALAGQKTLLIDCDLKKPRVNDLFQLPLGPGVSELLRGEVDIGDAVQATRISGLWLLPAGRYDSGARRSLVQGGLSALLGRLGEQFQFMVVDTSPILLVADSLLISQCTDLAILSLVCNVSRVPRVFEALERLASVGAHTLGAVVNGVQLPQDYSKYGRFLNEPTHESQK